MTSVTTAFALKGSERTSFWQDPQLAGLAGVFHLFTTRRGGVSQPPYDTWNLGLSMADDPAHVLTNRRLVRECLPGSPQFLLTARQVHGNQAEIIETPPADPPTCDALLTDRPGVPLMLQFADCIPLIGFDPVSRSVAVIHAGWRGTVAAITSKTIDAWCRRFGARPQDLYLAIGPGIGRCCYHLPPATIDQLLATVPELPREKIVALWPDRPNLAVDLAEINRGQALAAGVPAANIVNSGICTACNPQLAFSYRRDGPESGRMGAVVMLVG